MRGNMPFFQMKRIKSMVKIFGFLLAAFIIAGCAADKKENIQTSEQSQPETPDKIADVSDGRQIHTVKAKLQEQSIEIKIQANQKLVYTSIKQSFPFAIVLYFPDTAIAGNLKTTLPENKTIENLVVNYADESKTTVKIEILLKKDIDYEVSINDNILKVQLFGDMETNMAETDKMSEPLPAKIQKIPQESLESEGNSVVSDKTAIMTGIEFNTMEDGKSRIVVQTNHPVEYDIAHGDNDKLYLYLYNTVIPDHHKRPILTQYFNSAVERVIPVQISGEKKSSKIDIKLRDFVPYRVVQDQNVISMFFEPSSVKPPLFTKAIKKTASSTKTAQTQTDSSEVPESTADKKKTIKDKIFGPPKKYTGEKIKLDFYETDIKNVFRILKSVGKRNFAIDNDVQGKVTLSLEDPVPWDQVLDLVLKMNDLGMKKEGNVIRIATLAKLQQEKSALQQAIAARKKSLEQKKSFEPLVTKYLSVNYSDAEKDIKPHLEQILSKERGKLSVDTRTNTIIITDTQAKIDQAQDIIYRLDKVTPQIMIEAKVVEVTKEFSRELGLGLNFTERHTSTADVSSFDVALNHPAAEPVTSGSFNFFRLFGSSVAALNAQISASETKGDVKVVSSPRILTLDNKSAKIKQGIEYAYLERDDSGGSSVKFKNIDLSLEVTPHVTPDKRISMNIFLTKNDVATVTDGVPSLSTNEAQTELLVNNNDTIVIGGIVKTDNNESSSGVPILSGIPILGRLFRTDIDIDKRNELLIFITPTIVQLEQKKKIY